MFGIDIADWFLARLRGRLEARASGVWWLGVWCRDSGTRPPSVSTGSKNREWRQQGGSIWRVEIGILANLALHLLAFLLVMQQNHPVTEMLFLDLQLRLSK